MNLVAVYGVLATVGGLLIFWGGIKGHRALPPEERPHFPSFRMVKYPRPWGAVFTVGCILTGIAGLLLLSTLGGCASTTVPESNKLSFRTESETLTVSRPQAFLDSWSHPIGVDVQVEHGEGRDVLRVWAEAESLWFSLGEYRRKYVIRSRMAYDVYEWQGGDSLLHSVYSSSLGLEEFWVYHSRNILRGIRRNGSLQEWRNGAFPDWPDEDALLALRLLHNPEFRGWAASAYGLTPHTSPLRDLCQSLDWHAREGRAQFAPFNDVSVADSFDLILQ